MPPPWLLGRGRPRWWSWWSSGRRLGVAACGLAVAAGLLVSLCSVSGALASDLRRKTEAVAASAAHPGGDQAANEVQQGVVVYAGRRLLSGGPGSHPPRCTSKCGSCSPCYPVHVSVPPGVLVTTEYYPEAWRCKCRNQLYMP